MTDKPKPRPKPLDAPSVNPRYEGLTLGGMSRILTRPRNPAARAALDRLQGRSVTGEKMEEGEPAVKSGL